MKPFTRHLAASHLAALLCGIPLFAGAAVKTERVEYRDGDTLLTGYLSYDDAIEGKRPGVLVIHEWWGLNDYAKRRAEMLAELGYVAFAADMYGDNKVTEHSPDAQSWMQQISANQDAWRQRAMAALDTLKSSDRVDAEKLAAIGYCFGGATVMQMAYGGAELDGVASFHGSLPPTSDVLPGQIKPSILIAHGEADSFVPPERIAAFKERLDAAGADWQMVVYSGAQHSFTNPGAASYGVDGIAYDPKADARSWALMQGFFDEVFAD